MPGMDGAGPEPATRETDDWQQLICPKDQSTLVRHDAGYRCPACTRTYPIRDGVVCLVERSDEFYEGTYENKVKFVPKSEKLWNAWPLWLLNSGYVWTVRKFVPKGAVLVELGCAGGVTYFGHRYRSVACDLSFTSVKLADSYSMRIQADASECIPLPEGSVDAIVSSFFWEHILPELKEKILHECLRVLKPTGKLIFLYDVETENPLIRRYKSKDPALYSHLFIEGDGHVGYQTPAQNLRTFQITGLRLVKHLGLEKTWLQYGSVYEKLSRFPGGKRLWTLRTLLNSRLFYPYVVLMRVIDTVLCPWLPQSWARIDMVVLEKPSRRLS